jgi:hypothetical protein
LIEIAGTRPAMTVECADAAERVHPRPAKTCSICVSLGVT